MIVQGNNIDSMIVLLSIFTLCRFFDYSVITSPMICFYSSVFILIEIFSLNYDMLYIEYGILTRDVSQIIIISNRYGRCNSN